jgi:hypothetical protein
MGTINQRPLHAYVRFDGSGRVVAGSLILRRKMPKVGKWQEITAYECCNTPLFACVSYSVAVARGDSVTFSYTACGGGISGPHTLNGPVSDVFCAVPATIAYTGTAVFTLLGECTTTTTTTTTTTSSTTTTTTTII